MTSTAKTSLACLPEMEMRRLHASGFNLLPLGAGPDGKAPLRAYQGVERLPLRQVLGPMSGKNSACYGIRLPGLAVIDCDVDDIALVKEMEARFGASPVHVKTPRGLHLYYQNDALHLPNLRAEGVEVDIKRGATSYVMGPGSVRPDGGEYSATKGVLGIDTLPRLAVPSLEVSRTFSASVPKGDRNQFLTKAAIEMVEAVDGPDELFGNLQFTRDEQCHEPQSIADSELRKIAEWAWTKRLEGKVFRGKDSEFTINRQALGRLTNFENQADALALFVVLQANHGHIPGQTFPLDHRAMVNAGHTSLGRRRFSAAIQTLLSAGLLGIAKEYSVGHSRRSYRLLRIRPDLPNVHSLFPAKEPS